MTTSSAFDVLPSTPETQPSLEELWMPFTANRAFKRAPRMLVAAKGMYYTAADGRQILDGTAGLWCVNAGHCRESITAAIREQAGVMDYAPPFQMGHPLAFELAQQLVRMLPGDIDHVFFGNSGSEAVDTALKIALAYWQSKGQPQRVRFIGRSRGYHGVGFGGIAVGGIEANRKQFAGQLLPAVDHLQHTHDLSRNAYSRGQPRQGAELANELEAVVQKYGADTIAAVIVEPVAGSTGVLIPPVGYLDRLREICDRHGILLIFDEVITGFGRLGAPFAADKFGVVPDIMTVAKGITNATVPMGAVCVRHGIYDCVVNASASGIELFHGYTYSGHPLAAAAGLATLDVYRTEGLFERAASLEDYFGDAVHALRGTRHVVDLRNIGIVGAVELEARPGAPGARGFEAFLKCFDAGVLVRSTGDTLALSPPLIVEREEIDRIFETVGQALREIA
ncbi:MAG TPA: aspartate aminotransferase family protein [Gemmatimonadaceae bacterium]|jgi:beta-alanine--pyruvate transaminase|nr:aspartate aminotransferase family protein [Gemmatimonadaceae bacterium]